MSHRDVFNRMSAGQRSAACIVTPPPPKSSTHETMRRLVTIAVQSTTLLKTAAVTAVECVTTDASGPLTSSPQLATYAWRSFAAGGTLGGMPADKPDIDTKTTPSAAPDVTPDRGWEPASDLLLPVLLHALTKDLAKLQAISTE